MPLGSINRLHHFRLALVEEQMRPAQRLTSQPLISKSKAVCLQGRTVHVIHKTLAEPLAELGCTPDEIMANLGHSEARTTEVYTK